MLLTCTIKYVHKDYPPIGSWKGSFNPHVFWLNQTTWTNRKIKYTGSTVGPVQTKWQEIISYKDVVAVHKT